MRRLSISLLLVVVVAIFGLGIALDVLFERYNTKVNDPLSQVRNFGQGLTSILNSAASPAQILAAWPDSDSFRAILESSSDLPLPSSIRQSFESGEAVVLESEQGVSLYYFLDQHDKVLALQIDTVSGSRHDGLAWIFTGAFYIGTLALVLLWLKPLLHRLHILRNTTQAFGAGRLDSRVKTAGVTYIADIEKDFNRMADQIQQLVEDNKLLTSAVSHDLRTPLARLRFGIDTLSETSSSDSQEQYFNRVNKDLNEMEALVNSLLKYASLDHVMAGVVKESVSIRSLVGECNSQHYDNDISIVIDDSSISKDDSLVIDGRIEHLATLFNNVIQNAIRYANHQIIIEIKRSDESVIVTVCDDGPGIPSNVREQVMKPFERGAAAGKNGYGLGLAVAVRIAKFHDGYINIDDCDRLGGALINIYLGSNRGLL